MLATPLAGPPSPHPCVAAQSLAPSSTEVAVIGGGIIGLSAAWRLLQRGHSVVVIDPTPASGASFVAGGMLGATAETTFAEAGSVNRHLSARAEWDPFLRDLSIEVDRPLPYASTSTVMVAGTRSDFAEIEHVAKFQRKLNLRVDAVGRDELDRLVPGLGRSLRQGFHLIDDAAVDNRMMLQALLDAVHHRGGIVSHATAQSLHCEGDHFTVATSAGLVSASKVLIATGAAPTIQSNFELPFIHPVAGVIVRLTPRPNTLTISTTIRAVVNGRSCYLVPRPNGEITLGATSVERGYDLSVPAGELHQLLDDARTVFPSLDEYSIKDVEVGLRPTTSDHHPVVEMIQPGLTVALGHYRNGFLLAPATAMRVVELISKDPA